MNKNTFLLILGFLIVTGFVVSYLKNNTSETPKGSSEATEVQKDGFINPETPSKRALFVNTGEDTERSYTEQTNKELEQFYTEFNKVSNYLGKKFGNMTVTEGSLFNSNPIFNNSSKNIRLKLTGPTTITGIYKLIVDESGFSGYCMYDFDKESIAKLPSLPLEEIGSHPFFCFTNENFAKEILGDSEIGKKVTVIIDNYNLLRFPIELVDKAELISVVN